MDEGATIKYLIFDVESVGDGELVSGVKYSSEQLSPLDALAKFRQERREQYGTDFIPYTYQLPTAIVVAKVDAQFRLIDLVSLDEPRFRPAQMTKLFWWGWEHYQHPTLVTFNGRQFDLPLLELAAFRFGIQVPKWFNSQSRPYDQHRNRYNTESHFDLQELMTNFGASQFPGGLNLAAHLLGKPGKMCVQGYMVQQLYDDGKLQQISDYCRCDVLDTYFVLLRSAVLQGKLDLATEQQRVDAAKAWLESRRETCQAYVDYLSGWGDWHDPWPEIVAEQAAMREVPTAASVPTGDVP